MKIFNCVLSLFILIFISGCQVERDFGNVDNNPCEQVYCKTEAKGTSICIFKCKDGIYAVESIKLLPEGTRLKG